MKRAVSAWALAMAAAVMGGAQTGPRALVIEHARVFDGTRVMADAGVVVEGGVIRAVGTNVARPAGAEVVDGTAKTLLPGFIDSHTHTIGEALLEQAPVFGVTTDLDMFTDPAMAARIKAQQKEEKLPVYADLRSSGWLATVPGGHGTEYGLKVPTLTRPEEAQAWVDARVAEGSDYIKIIYDDAMEYGMGRPTPTLSRETLKALVDAAHHRGKLAVVHIGSLQQALDAIDAGADGLAHLFVGAASTPEFGKLAAAHHMFVIPTLTVLQSLCATGFNAELADDPRLKPYLPPAEIAIMKNRFNMPGRMSCEGANEAVRQLARAGVPLLAGTDVGNPGTTQGASIHGELELLVRAGLKPAEALHGATAAPAAAFHLDDRGRIAEGKRADLVLVNGDPTVDIRATRDIAAVWKAGQRIDREAWKAAVARKAEEAGRQQKAPAPAGSESGWISDFEQDGPPRARFGAGWAISTDQTAGGKSAAKMEVVAGGAEGSRGALRVTGEVTAGYAYPWSGVMFYPGSTPMAPANLSGRKAVRFWARGDGQTYEFMLFSQRRGYRPVMKTFVAGAEWREFTFPVAEFEGMNGSDIMGIVWAAGPKTGGFKLELDNVRVE